MYDLSEEPIQSKEQDREGHTAPFQSGPSLLDHALEYASKDLAVFPCSRDKKPLTEHGFKDATTDHSQIRAWWAQYPDASIGMAVPDGIMVLDVDLPKKPGASDGREALKKLETEHGPLPNTRTQQTGGGGSQLFFLLPSGKTCKNSAGKLGPGIDIRSKGGYVILPPSNHPSGGTYRWIDEKSPLAECPAWILEALDKENKKESSQAHFPVSTAGIDQPYIRKVVDGEIQTVSMAQAGTRNNTLNKAALKLGHYVGGGCLTESEASHLLFNAALSCGLPEQEARKTIDSGLRAGMREPKGVPERKGPEKSGNTLVDGSEVDQRKIIVKSDYLKTARKFIREQPARIITYQGEVLKYYDGSYIPVPGPDLSAKLLTWGGSQIDFETKDPFKPNRNWRGNVEDSVKALTNVPAEQTPSCWIDGREEPAAHDIISCWNGLLNIRNREILPATSSFFTLNALPFSYDNRARAEKWLSFMGDVFEGDVEAVQTLQEIFGYLLSADTSQQKIFSIIGPKRSGKGTIARIIRGLLGKANVAGPTLNSLSQQFGLAPLISKLLAIISDARLSGRADQAAIVERLLSVSGEDFLSVPRKYLQDISVQLPTRFLILSNELPRLGDASGALSSRFIILTMRKSYLGKEDPGLTARLLNELPGILNWALEGRDRLNRRGYFVQPESGKQAIQELEDLTSPISVFIRECCDVRPGVYIACHTLFDLWADWCSGENRMLPGTVQSFGRDLRAAVPGVETKGLMRGGERFRVYMGITRK